MEDFNSSYLDSERQTLVDYVRYYGNDLAENLSYVASYLHGNLPFMRMVRHARDIPNSDSCKQQDKQIDINDLVMKLTEVELPLVKDYIFALGAYLTGQPFELVREKAKKLSFSKPIPETAKIPSDSLFKTTKLGEMREEV